LHHCHVPSLGFSILLSSNTLFLLTKSDSPVIQWFHPLKEIQNAVIHKSDDSALVKFILTKEAAGKYYGWFSGALNERTITVYDPMEVSECENMCKHVRSVVTKKLTYKMI
jgi:hypothetical protein